MKKIRFSILAIPLLSAAIIPVGTALAEIQFNGFGSVRATQLDSDGGVSPFSYFEEGDLSFKSESLFALQARADLGEGLSATVQLYAEGRDDFDLEARWAYISYELSDNHQINAGKLANPIFHQSEYEKVGYAHNFSRLPSAVYTRFDFATMEGISLNSNFELADGDYNLETKLSYGNWSGEVFIPPAGDVPLGLDTILSINATLSGDWWKLYAGIFTAEMDAEKFDQITLLPALQPSIAAALAAGATQAEVDKFVNAVAWHEKDGVYWFTGFGVDYNNVLVDFEYTSYGVEDSVDAINENYYIALGYRLNEFIFTIHYEESEQPLDYGFLGGVTNPLLVGTGQVAQQVLAEQEFDGYGIALRYDFHPSAAFKIDYFSGENQRAEVGDYSIVSAGIDVVF